MTEDKNKEILNHALKMMEIDFEQRSQQVIQLALDRSRHLRISLAVWGVPLIIASSLLKNGLSLSPLEWNLVSILIISISFFIASFINCILLTSQISNGNSANLSASGMNFLRTIYFKKLIDDNGINIKMTENLKSVLCLDEKDNPFLKIVQSNSSIQTFKLTAFVNIFYGGVGFFLCGTISNKFLIIGIFLFLIVVAMHFFSLRLIKFIRI